MILNYRVNKMIIGVNIMSEIRRYIDLSGLERYNSGKLSGKIIWDKTIDKKFYFEYGDIFGYIKVIKCHNKKQTLDIEYKGNVDSISCKSFINCKLGKILNKYHPKFKVEINSVINDLLIVDREVRVEPSGKKRKYYKYICQVCDFENWIEEYNLLKGVKCSCCSHQVIVPDVNTISTTSPWMVKYLLDKNDASKYTSQSEKVIKFKCPNCGFVKKSKIGNVYNQGFSCSKCSDGIKYPEKFMINLLSYLNVEHIRELSSKDFEWCGSYRYDFYLPEYNMIIETHGKQHYEYTGWHDVNKQQEIDIEKKKNALNNDIQKYITLDCRKSNMDFIKSSIMSSELVDYFKFENVDWNSIHKNSLNNLIKDVCEYYESHDKDMKRQILRDAFNIKSNTTLVKYLKIGTELGWCKYESKNKSRDTN